jgi:predicted SprT family Zn-dependent metalloprotease
MNTSDAYALARKEMNKWGLGHWILSFNRKKRERGCCWYTLQKIELSEHFVNLNSYERVRVTVLHEIAHALTGPGHGHDWRWKAIVEDIGGIPERCTTSLSDETVDPPQKVIAVCENCGYEVKGYRRMKKKNVACRSCCERYNNGRWDSRFVMKQV